MSDIRSPAFRPTPEHMTRLGELSRSLISDPQLEATIAPEPAQSVVSEAAAILDQLNDGLNPSDREAADAALALAILARAQTLIDAAKARLQP